MRSRPTPRTATRREARTVRARAEAGFSVLELMNILTIVAVLGCLGMYGLATYVRRSKTAEAISSVEAIAKGAATFYDESDFTQPTGSKLEALHASRHFPPSSRASVPADPNDVAGKRYKSSQADWLGSPWREIRFSLPQPQHYAYAFEADGAGTGATATATARGDLDGNDLWAVYKLGVKPDESFVARIGTTVERENPEE